MEKFLKKLSVFCLIATLAAGFTSCGDDDPEPEPEPQPKNYTLLYAALIPSNNLDCGTVSFTATDPTSNKQISVSLPDNGINDWNNEAYKAVNAKLEAVSTSLFNYKRCYLRYIKVDNVKSGQKYSATITFTPDKDKINGLNQDEKIFVGDVAIYAFAVNTADNYVYTLSDNIEMGVMDITVSDFLSNLESISATYFQPFKAEGILP